MAKTAYFDCFSGISGDMILAALLDAGLDFSQLKKHLKKIRLSGYEIIKGSAIKNHIKATTFTVKIKQKQRIHRDIKTIKAIIDKSKLGKHIKERIIKIFDLLASAEAKVHGVRKEEIHFHEIGAVDSIIDIAGAVIGLFLLGVDNVYSSALPVSSGYVKAEHGILPMPAPAAAYLMKNVTLFNSGIKGEMMTPTGIAILKGFSAFFGSFPGMVVEKIGLGAGKNNFKKIPNVLRVFISGEKSAENREIVAVVETNIDNETGETLGYVMDKLFKAGALDVFFTPVFMKKNRPAYKITAICEVEKAENIVNIIFRELKTGGARVSLTPRIKRSREIRKVKTRLGLIDVKIFDGNKDFYTLEYENCAKIARKMNMPLTKAVNDATKEIEKNAELL